MKEILKKTGDQNNKIDFLCLVVMIIIGNDFVSDLID